MQSNIQSSNLARSTEAVAPRVAIEVDIPYELAGRIIGRKGAIVHRIERDAGIRVRVEGTKPDAKRTFVTANGTIEQVHYVFNEVKAEVAEVDITIAEQLKCELKHVLETTRPVESPNGGSMRFGRAQQNVSEWNINDLSARLTVSAREPTFKTLIGRNGENIEEIRRESGAQIKIEDQRYVDETRRVYIDGTIANVVCATQMVKESLQLYDPMSDISGRSNLLNSMDLKVIKAEARIRIMHLAAGFLIGKKGQNVERIKQETNVEYLVLKESEDTGLLDCVCIAGHVTPVLEAIQQIQNSLKYLYQVPGRYDLQSEATEDTQITYHRNPFATEPQAVTQAQPAMAMASTTSNTQAPSLLQPPTPPTLAPRYAIPQDGSGLQIHLVRQADGRYTPFYVNTQESPLQQNRFPPLDSGARGFPVSNGIEANTSFSSCSSDWSLTRQSYQ